VPGGDDVSARPSPARSSRRHRLPHAFADAMTGQTPAQLLDDTWLSDRVDDALDAEAQRQRGDTP
jgi:hypothetical protein